MQVLDKVFMSIVLLAASFWDAAAPEQAQQASVKISGLSKTSMAVSLLDTLAHLQFCRMRLSAYSVLLQNLLQAAASSAEVTPCHLVESAETNPSSGVDCPSWVQHSARAVRLLCVAIKEA